MKIIIWIARILIAAIFLYAGVIKLGASERFTVTVANFSILPPQWAAIVGVGLPWLEAVAALMLLVPWTTRIGAGIISLLLVTFIGALGWALHEGFLIDCGCFGDEPAMATPATLVFAIARDFVLLAVTLGLAWKRPH